MEDCFLRPFQRVDCSMNKIGTAWRKNLDPDIIRRQAWSLNKSPYKVVVSIARGWKGNLDFFVALDDIINQHFVGGPRGVEFTISTSSLKYVNFWSLSIGSTRAWFPCTTISQRSHRSRKSLTSRKSVDSHLGGFCIDFDGHWRFGKFRGGKGRYLVELRRRVSVTLGE